MADKNTIKNWFKTGMIPTQDQFWSVFDSFRHKDEAVPVADVEGINELLATRASQQVLDNHLAQKGAPNGYAPLDEFTKLAAQYLNIVNDLVTGGDTALLSAEQGKILRNQVSAINTLLTSDNVNLDTVQELVDAIETVQLSLSTILVNDLTTGGTTKALTAEMGKTLKGLVDALYSNANIDTLLAGKSDKILALKTITGTAYSVIADDSLTELVYDGTAAMTVTIPNNSTVPMPLGTVFYSVATNTGVLTIAGAAGVTFQTAVGLSGAQNEVRKYTKRGTNVWGIEGNVVSSADMILASAQTVSGLKTFLSGMFGLRNVANTFTSFLTNTNTASRTYTLQNRNGTLADDTDLAGKMAVPSGTVNYLAKFLTATTVGVSRLWDTGSFFGIGTSYSPYKDLTLGNQNNKDIGIEESDANTVGRDLTISAGRTNDYLLTSLFTAVGTGFSLASITISSSGDIYVLRSDGNILKQTGGTGAFVATNPNITNFTSIAIHPNGNMYGIIDGVGSTVYMQTGGSGNFNAIASINYLQGLAIAPNGDVYVSGWFNGNIYKQTGGTGGFSSLGQTARTWKSLCATPTGDIYATVVSGDIYKQTGGTGAFIATGQTSRDWRGITSLPNGNVYAVVNGGDVYMQAGGTGGFNPKGQSSRAWYGIAATPTGNIYATAGDLYFLDLSAKGASNLNGGTLKLKSGTGKGTGQNKVQIITGQKTSSGTDMQVETVRAEFDENGNYKRIGTPVYADNAAALAGGLTAGMEYRTSTGIKMEVY